MNMSLGPAELNSAIERSKCVCAESLSLLKVSSKHSTFLTLDTGYTHA